MTASSRESAVVTQDWLLVGKGQLALAVGSPALRDGMHGPLQVGGLAKMVLVPKVNVEGMHMIQAVVDCAPYKVQRVTKEEHEEKKQLFWYGNGKLSILGEEVQEEEDVASRICLAGGG